MNLIMLFESDFINSTFNKVRLKDHRREHILKVCRSKLGGMLKVGLWNGKMGIATITAINDCYVELEAELVDSAPPPIPLTLLLALPRPKSFKKCIEVATCMGIKQIFIFESWRVEKSYWKNPVLQEENLKKHILLGLEQAKDTMPPRIEFRRYFKRFVEDEVSSIVQNTMALIAHPYANRLCPNALKTPVTLVIGPEGGFIPYEIDLLERNGFSAVTIGERILRVEYAIAAIAGRLFV